MLYRNSCMCAPIFRNIHSNVVCNSKTWENQSVHRKKKMVQSLGYIHTVKLPGSENENEWMIAVDNNMDES